MNHNDRFQPRDLAELRDIVAPMLARMIKGSDITTHGAMHAALLANQHYGDVWAAATQCEILYGRARLTSSAVLGIMAASGKVQIEYEEQSTTRVCIVATRENFGTVRSDWPMERARVAGYTKNALYQKSPTEMLRGKAIMEIARQIAGDLVGGVTLDEDVADFAATAAAVQREAETLVEAAPPRPGSTKPRAETPAPVTPTPTVSPVDLVTSLVAECGYADDAAFMAALAGYLHALDPAKASTIASQWQVASASQVADWSAKIRDRLLPPLVEPVAEPVAETTVEPVAETTVEWVQRLAAQPALLAEPVAETTVEIVQRLAAQPALLVETVVPPAPPAVEGKQPTSPATLIRREIKRLVEAGLVIWRDEETTSAYLKGCTPEGRAELWSIIDAHKTDSARASELVSLGGIRKL
jgi:hypothetical protein